MAATAIVPCAIDKEGRGTIPPLQMPPMKSWRTLFLNWRF
jgi:hypothetical protein